MEKIMGWRMDRMTKDQKREMMLKMMPKMIENMRPQDIMDMMSQMMPSMMANCLNPMTKEERRKMLDICHGMLAEVETRFL